MAIHSFSADLAELVGIEGAIIYKNIQFWIEKNKANDKEKIKGYYWTYNSWEAWQELFPYMKKYTIKKALEKLKEVGLIDYEIGINPENKWDKTTYYRLIETSNIDSGQNQTSREDKIKHHYKEHIINTDNKHISKEKTKKEKIIEILNQQDLTNINVEALIEWIEYKKWDYQKAGITKLINLLSKYSYDIQQDIVDKSIMNGYKGLFEPKQKFKSKQDKFDDVWEEVERIKRGNQDIIEGDIIE